MGEGSLRAFLGHRKSGGGDDSKIRWYGHWEGIGHGSPIRDGHVSERKAWPNAPAQSGTEIFGEVEALDGGEPDPVASRGEHWNNPAYSQDPFSVRFSSADDAPFGDNRENNLDSWLPTAQSCQ